MIQKEREAVITAALDTVRGHLASPFEIVSALIVFLSIKAPQEELRNFPWDEAKRTVFNAIPDGVRSAFNILLDPLDHLHADAYNRVLHVLGRLHLSDSEELNACFETSITLSLNSQSGIYPTPKELTEFMTSVYPLYKGDRIYNPFSGYASYAKYLPEGAHYYGQELNRSTWALGVLNLYSKGIFDSADYRLEDSIRNWNQDQFDVILSNPPFGLRINPAGYPTQQRDAETFAIERAISQLAPGGRAVIITTNGFLFNKVSRGLRQQLIESGLLEFVIQLPPDIFRPSTGISTSVICLNRSPRKQGGVSFIDAGTHTIIKEKKRCLNVETLLEEVAETPDSSSKVWSPVKEIVAHDYNLSVNRYLIRVQDTFQEDLIPLGKLLTPLARQTPGSRTTGIYINPKDLKNDRIESVLKLENQSETDVPKQATLITESALLVTLRGQSLRPTWIENPSDLEIFLYPEIWALKINREAIDPVYLISQLHSDFVRRQLERFTVGVTIPSISKADFLKIRIHLPDHAQQKAVVKALREALIEHKETEISQLRKLHQVQSEAFSQLASLKHSMGRPLMSLTSGLSNIERFIETQAQQAGPTSLDAEMYEGTSHTLRDSFNTLKRSLELISNLLEKNEAELELTNYPLVTIDLVSILKMATSHFNSLSFSFRTSLELSLDIVQELKGQAFIKANPDLVEILFNNILDNAERHAFRHVDQEENEVRISLDVNNLGQARPSLIIRVSNNGERFADNFDKVKLVRKNGKAGATGNTGMGGYDINRITEYLEGHFDLILNQNEDFPTEYQLEFPLQDLRTPFGLASTDEITNEDMKLAYEMTQELELEAALDAISDQQALEEFGLYDAYEEDIQDILIQEQLEQDLQAIELLEGENDQIELLDELHDEQMSAIYDEILLEEDQAQQYLDELDEQALLEALMQSELDQQNHDQVLDATTEEALRIAFEKNHHSKKNASSPTQDTGTDSSPKNGNDHDN